ncbi:MAG TPA: HD domain-containing protein [Candidatus Magasanikbacteria bacterium]|nr:HD domain-containing protein [Candidatus Magasanikbacteria bacterium]
MDWNNKAIKAILAVSKKEETPIFLVGGAVRDLFLEMPQKKDLDFVVVGSGLVFAKALDKKMKEAGSLVEFPDFDTARYILGEDENKIELEFAGARTESYLEKSRKPQVFPATLETDLSRRDFTVNAMALPVDVFSKTKSKAILKKKVIDPFQGQKHLEEKILITPLDPDKTFSEDPLRMLRAVRFASQLNFSIDKKVLESIHKNRRRLEIISAERIREELFKLLSTKQPSVGLMLMFHTGLLDIVLPEVSKLDGVEEIFGHQHKNNFIHTLKVVDNVALYSEKTILRFAALLHDIGKPGTKKFVAKTGWTFNQHEHLGRKMTHDICRRLKMSKEETKYATKLVRWHQHPIALMDEEVTDSAVRRLIVSLGEELSDLLILGRCDITTGNPNKKEQRLKNYDNLEKRIAEVLEIDKMRAFQSPIRGEEIMEVCHLKPGPTVGKIKKAIEEAILDGKIGNNYEESKKYFEKIKEDFLKEAKDFEKGE